jgi:hypothetical protein
VSYHTDKLQGFVNTLINIWVAENLGNFLASSGTLSFSSSTLVHVVSQSVCLVCQPVGHNDKKFRLFYLKCLSQTMVSLQ